MIFFCDFLQNFHFFSKNFFFQFFFAKFISFYFLEFLSDFGANTLKMSEICYTFQKNLKRGNNLSFSHQNKQISIFGLFFKVFKENTAGFFVLNHKFFEIFQSIRGTNAWGNERVGQKTIFRWNPAKTTGGGWGYRHNYF